jgi:aflatoxin B1 aldehyde reductase
MASTTPLVVLGCGNIGASSDAFAKFNTPEMAQAFLNTFHSYGFTHLDTARSYSPGAPGTSEPLIGQTDFASWAVVDSKAMSFRPGAHKAELIAESIDATLEALGVSKVHIYYLHVPDRETLFEETCRAMNEAYEAGKFEKFGLSNFRADEVEEIYKICEEHAWVRPTVYQGHYNAIARRPEEDLLPTLRKYNISYYAYSPGAGGMFSGMITRDSINNEGTRWDKNTLVGQISASNYHKDALFDAAKKVHDAAEKAGISGHAIALRWMLHHSALNGGDAMIIGASSLQQLEGNLEICKAGPLPAELLKVVEDVWGPAKDFAPSSSM